MSTRTRSAQFLKFLVAGGVAAAVNVGSRVLLGHWIDYVPSIIGAFCLGLVTAFALNKVFVFNEASNRLHHQVFWFVAINLAAVLQTLAISLLVARWLLPTLHVDFHNDTIGHALGVAVPVITSYIGHKRLSFRS